MSYDTEIIHQYSQAIQSQHTHASNLNTKKGEIESTILMLMKSKEKQEKILLRARAIWTRVLDVDE